MEKKKQQLSIHRSKIEKALIRDSVLTISHNSMVIMQETSGSKGNKRDESCTHKSDAS